MPITVLISTPLSAIPSGRGGCHPLSGYGGHCPRRRGYHAEEQSRVLEDELENIKKILEDLKKQEVKHA
jgi:hypothetical protein